MYVAPNSVSGRVVKTAISTSESSTRKSTSAPSERPIQLRCISLSESLQSMPSRSSSKRCAYSVIRNIHCCIGRRTTGKPPTSLTPSLTSSLASTVPSSGHQFTGASDT